jgi:putative Holliday junction resolvase
VSRILGVDLGARRIGLALSDPSGTIASPLDVVERSGDESADREAILAAAGASGAQRIVVGMPTELSGKRGTAAREALAEIDALRSAAGDRFEIEAYDERMTTVIAERTLIGAGERRAARKEVVDKVAAAVMLQGYLESHR